MDAHVPCSISGLFWGTPERPLPALSSQQSWSSPKRGEPGQKHLLSLKSRERLQSFEQQPVMHGAVASSLLPSWENPEQTLPTCWNRPRSSTPEQKQSHCQTQLVTNIITFSFVLRKLLGNVGVLQQWQSLVCLGFFFQVFLLFFFFLFPPIFKQSPLYLGFASPFPLQAPCYGRAPSTWVLMQELAVFPTPEPQLCQHQTSPSTLSGSRAVPASRRCVSLLPAGALEPLCLSSSLPV